MASEATVDFAAGWISGASSIFLLQPMDMLIVRTQLKDYSARAAARSLAVSGGASAFWRGSMPMMWSVPLQNAVLFTGYSAGANWEGGGTSARDSAPLSHVFTGGCVGGFAQSFVMSPVELVKIRMQMLALDGRSAGLSILSGGTFFKGLGATFGRDVIPHGVWFASWEASKRQFAAWEGVSEAHISAAAHLASGAVAATVAWLVGYPFDVIKTRMQAHGGGSGGDAAEFSLSMTGMARRMQAREGVAVFYRGLGLKLARAIPQSAVGFYLYETVAKFLRQGSPSDGTNTALS